MTTSLRKYFINTIEEETPHWRPRVNMRTIEISQFIVSSFVENDWQHMPHPYTTWTSLYPSFPSKILHFRCLSYCGHLEQRESNLCDDFSAVCILRCTFKLPLRLNVLSQSGQDKRLFISVYSTMHIQIANLFSTSCHNQDRRTDFYQYEFSDAHSNHHFV